MKAKAHHCSSQLLSFDLELLMIDSIHSVCRME